jgi:hypothetical protein
MGLPALFLSSALVQVGAARQAGKAQERAAKFNAMAAMESAAEDARALELEARGIRGMNRTIIAKSGVRAEGSPLAALALNDMRIERQKQRILRAGRIQSGLFYNQAESARTGTRYSIAGELLGGAARAGLAATT